MKTRVLSLLLALALLLPCFLACNNTDTPFSTEGGTISGDSMQNVDREEAAETEPDYSDYILPEETDNLTIYGFPFYDDTLRRALDLFQERYPEVKIDYQLLGEDEYQTRLRTEIPAGRGPDVLIGNSSILPDIYKTMSTGIFTDCGPYMANDPEYCPEDYYEGVTKGGVMFGKQYLLPITFGMGCLLTTRELLEENGIRPDSLADWDGFISACIRYHENNPEKRLFNIGSSYNLYYLSELFFRCGFRMIDYEKNEVSFDENRFREMVELCRLYCFPTVPEDLVWGEGSLNLRDRECFFLNETTSSISQILNECYLIDLDIREAPVLLSVPNEKGGVSAKMVTYAAIPEASRNKLNAWRFTKIMLSDEIQVEPQEGNWLGTAFGVGNPVRKESLHRIADTFQKYFYPDTDEIVEAYLSTADRINDAVMLPPIMKKYVQESMVPYIKSKDGSNYEKQLAKLKSTLELYKDE